MSKLPAGNPLEPTFVTLMQVCRRISSDLDLRITPPAARIVRAHCACRYGRHPRTDALPTHVFSPPSFCFLSCCNSLRFFEDDADDDDGDDDGDDDACVTTCPSSLTCVLTCFASFSLVFFYSSSFFVYFYLVFCASACVQL